ncbi:MAG: hypothetical protein IJ689_07910, partial [Alphaproteobacteria bacterium]|nr:hypothetical protein [Alphaproteobacteria bacterium]
YDYTGNIIYYTQGAIVSAQDTRVGMFTANIANPADCNGIDIPCGGLSVTGNIGYSSIYNLFGGNDNSNHCEFIIKASEPEYNFAVFPFSCSINDVSKVTTGEHSGTLTISYNPE